LTTRNMTTKSKAKLDDVMEWYLGFNARFTDLLDEHRDDEDQLETVRQASRYCDEWEERSRYLPMNLQVQDALHMFSECFGMRGNDDINGFGALAERCSDLFIERVKGLKAIERRVHAYRVAKMFDGNFGSSVLERMLTELVGPMAVGEVLDVIRLDLYYRYKDSDDLIFDIMDERYREFAIRLIEISGRSSRGDLKRRLTIRIH